MEPTYFKRWSNKKWAVLASLNKVIIIGVLSVSYQMLAQEPGNGRSDTISTSMNLELEEVESLGELPGELENASLKPLMVVSKQDIHYAPATSHEDILEILPQIDVRQRGKHGIQSDLSIQGGSFDQSMVLLNGINLSDPQTGHFQLNLPVDLHDLDKIEVATGAATRQYGTNAFAGAVNLVTRPQDSTFFNGGLRAGQYGYYKGRLKANLAGRHLSMLTSFSSSGSSGYRENTDFKTNTAYFHARTGKEKLEIHLMAGFNTRAFGANAFYSPRFIHQYEEGTTGFAALKALGNLNGIKYRLAAYGRVNRDLFLLERSDPAFYNNHHLSWVSGADAQMEFFTIAGKTHTGLHYRSEQIRSTSLGESLSVAETAPYNDSILFTNGHFRYHFNWNVNHVVTRGPVTLSGGFMMHFNSDLGFSPRIYPGIDLRMQLPALLRVYASYNRSMRLPTFTDLYYKGPSNVGNPDLQPEHASLWELGLYRKSRGWKLDVNMFHRQGNNLIDWIWKEDQKWHTMNLTRVDATGFSLSANYKIISPGKSWINLSSANASYSFTHLNKISDQVTSRYVLDPLRHKLVLGTGLQIANSFHLQINVSAQDREGSYLELDHASGGFMEKAYDPFVLADLKLTYKIRMLHIFIEATNLFDKEYNDIGNVIQPGRWFILGFRIF